MSEIPVDQVKFELPEELPTFRLDRERNIALFEKYTLPKLKSEAKNLSETLASYKQGDYESYKKLTDIINTISNLH